MSATSCRWHWAQDERGQTGSDARPTELARVYVNLETGADPSLIEVLLCLGIARQEWPQALTVLKGSNRLEGSPFKHLAKVGTVLVRVSDAL